MLGRWYSTSWLFTTPFNFSVILYGVSILLSVSSFCTTSVEFLNNEPNFTSRGLSNVWNVASFWKSMFLLKNAYGFIKSSLVALLINFIIKNFIFSSMLLFIKVYAFLFLAISNSKYS